MPIHRNRGPAVLVLARVWMLVAAMAATTHQSPPRYIKASDALFAKHLLARLAAIALLGMSSASFGQEAKDPVRAMTMKCEYSEYKSSHREAVSLERAAEHAGEAPVTKVFRKGESDQSATYMVAAGEVAECVFPSGHRVRAKVGEGSARPYGECGADAQVFASVWVNGRKLISREWFAGHCRERFAANTEVSFEFFDAGRTSFQKCHARRTAESPSSAQQLAANEPLKVCVDYPDVSRFPRDPLEYPPSGRRTLSRGKIELLSGAHKVCKVVLSELREDFQMFRYTDTTKKTALRRPDWRTASVDLPESISGAGESIFDFDNDGKQDRVLVRDFEGTYMDGSILLVQPGKSAWALDVRAELLDTASWALPCQLDPEVPKIQECPRLSESQRYDEAGFWVPAKRRADAVHFRARYAGLSPFTFEGTSYVGVRSASEDTANYVAILKPLPRKRHAPMCLFRQAEENF